VEELLPATDQSLDLEMLLRPLLTEMATQLPQRLRFPALRESGAKRLLAAAQEANVAALATHIPASIL